MVPIYRSDGEWVGVYHKGHLFNLDGEWLGFVQGREVYDPGGLYLGFFSDDKRLLRTRSNPRNKPHLQPPSLPERPKIPSSMPMAPLFSALPHNLIDMFEEYPDRLIYVSETRPDMD